MTAVITIAVWCLIGIIIVFIEYRHAMPEERDEEQDRDKAGTDECK